MRRYSAPVAVGVALVALALALRAGPLDPPAGPIVPTYKTLSEVEPRIAVNATNTPGDANNLFRITQPGSYYLTGNITGVSGKNGISIEASGVTLDLNGFEMLGVAGSIEGVTIPSSLGNLKSITVTNGSVRAWGQDGVSLSGTGAIRDCRVTDLSAYANGSSGINGAIRTEVVRCIAEQNNNFGIRCTDDSTVTGCNTNSNGFGILTGQGCTVSSSTSSSNSFFGIGCADAGTIIDCVARGNSSAGIITSSGCTIIDCTADGNSSEGISIDSGCTVERCTAHNNGTAGISAGTGCTIIGCTCRSNTYNGIGVASGCIIRANDCTANGSGGTGAGILATGGNNRIEENNCTSADYGVLLQGAGNFVARNTCANNTTNWSFVPNNVFGPIIDRRSPASGAVAGNSAASSLGSTDANANFSY